jgi:undecaprenyl-diphosphatase
MGIFQGIAEFLPISSSGHLALLQYLFDIKEGNLFYTEMLHFGTLISIFIVYFKDIARIIYEFIALIGSVIKGKRAHKLTKHQWFGLIIIIGSIPTALIGLTFKDFFESLYTSIIPIGAAFIVTGFLLWIAEKKGNEGKDVKDVKLLDAILIGIFQGIAIIPGISRSGSTIVGGLFRGLKKPVATEFSFLLALPATFGAFLLGMKDVAEGGGAFINGPLVLGVALSAVTGVFAIKALIKLLNNNKLKYFSYYLWALGILTIVMGFVNN